MKRPERTVRVYTHPDNGGTYSIMLTLEQVRFVEHKRDADYVCDTVDILNDMAWWAAYGMLERMRPEMMGPTFKGLVDMLAQHEVRVKP